MEARLTLEELIAEISGDFVDLAPSEVDRGIDEALRRVCLLLDIDLAVLWQWSQGTTGKLIPTRSYVRGGSASDGSGSLARFTKEQFPWCVAEMSAGRVVLMPSLDSLPAQAAVDRESCVLHGIQSSLTLPLTIGGEPHVGALAFNTLVRQRDWAAPLVQSLRVLAQIFTNALARERRERRLQETSMRLAAAAEIAGLGFYDASFESDPEFVHDKLDDLFGVPPSLTGSLQVIAFWIDRLHADDRASVLRAREQLHSGELQELSTEYRFLHPTCGERWIQHLAKVSKRDAAGRASRTFGIIRDVTDSRRAADALRDLSSRLMHAYEDERALLARELHDDVTQRLAVLAIEVGRAQHSIVEPTQAQAMRLVQAELARLSEDIHGLAYQLHPSVLEELGLEEALKAECERRSRRERLELVCDFAPLTVRPGKNAALCIFRVAQEAMNNVTRHAGARAAMVTLRQAQDGIVLAIRDDGVGFDPSRRGSGRSLGLQSMRERLRLVNGTLEIDAAPGRGTTVIAWIPLEHALA